MVKGRYCPAHQHERWAHIDKARQTHDRDRASASQRGYGAQWRKVRAAKLARDPFCQLRTKCAGALATEVDHKDGNNGNNAPDNLNSTCRSCHSYKTVKEQGRFGRTRTRSGKQ